MTPRVSVRPSSFVQTRMGLIKLVFSAGHDLETGTPIDAKTYAKMNPNGRAILKFCNYRPPVDGITEDYPLGLLTGRNHLHFHTRTKTGRSKRLNDADPMPYVQLHAEDAEPLGIKVSTF